MNQNSKEALPKLYQLKLSLRTECYADISRVLTEFESRTEDVEEHSMKGFIGELHIKQSELAPGVFIPDFDVPMISFRIWVKDSECPKLKMSQLIKRFLDSIEKVPDTHVIRGSIDYQSRYDGSRDECLQINPTTGILDEIDQYLEKLTNP